MVFPLREVRMSKVLQAVAVLGVVACVECAARARDAATAEPPCSPPDASSTPAIDFGDDPDAHPVGQEIDPWLCSSASKGSTF